MTDNDDDRDCSAQRIALLQTLKLPLRAVVSVKKVPQKNGSIQRTETLTCGHQYRCSMPAHARRCKKCKMRKKV